MNYLKRQGSLLGLLVLFCLLPGAYAQLGQEKVAGIVVTNFGPKVASDEFVRGNIHVKAGDVYVRSSIDQDVLNLYKTGFFSNIRVTDQHTSDGVILTYLLQGKLRITAVNIHGNTKVSTRNLMKKITSKKGDPLDERKLFNDCLEMQKLYEKKGYQHTVVKYEEGNFDYLAGVATVDFQVIESPKIRIVDVVFDGAKAFKQGKLRHVIKTRRHWWLSWLTRSGVYKEDQFADDKDTLADFYRGKGYIDFEIKDVKFTYPAPGRMIIHIEVFEGTQYKVGSVTITGNKLFTTDQIVAWIKGKHDKTHSKVKIGEHGLEADAGLTFKPDSLDHDIKSIEDFYGSKGYINVRQGPNLRVSKIPNVDTGTMDLEYAINEGEKVYIEKILIKGNVKTKDKVIRRELAVIPGEPFDMVLVQLSKERLEQLTYFERVDARPEPTDVPNHDDLVINVDEKSTGNFTFGAGFNTVESIFGYAEIEQRNFDLFKPPYFTGGGQKLRLRVQVGAELQDYLLSFEEPWFLDRKLRLGVDLYRSVANYVSLNSLYDVTRTGAKVSLTRALGSDFLIGSVSYNIEQVGITSVDTNAPTSILNEAGYNLENRFGATIAYDTRNSVRLPNKGQITELDGLISAGDRNYYKLELKSSWFSRGIAPDHVIQLAGKVGFTHQLDGPDVPFYDRFYLGGQDTLRGFDYHGVGPREPSQDGTLYEPIGGDSYWFGTLEYTIPLIDHLAFALFYDIGNVSPRAYSFGQQTVVDPFGNPQGRTGSFSDDYGLGLRLDIPTLGPLKLDYGIPIHHDGFNGSSGKFQFGVGFQRLL
jgi:outer membrane protein insertion porin family